MKTRKRIALSLCLGLLTAGTTAIQAQTCPPHEVWALIGARMPESSSILDARGFKEVYSGPKKEGGILSLVHRKKSDEFLFIHADDSGKVQSVHYYVPHQAQYDKLLVDKKQLLTGEICEQMGRVIYEGKKYYHVILSRESLQLPAR